MLLSAVWRTQLRLQLWEIPVIMIHVGNRAGSALQIRKGNVWDLPPHLAPFLSSLTRASHPLDLFWTPQLILLPDSYGSSRPSLFVALDIKRDRVVVFCIWRVALQCGVAIVSVPLTSSL